MKSCFATFLTLLNLPVSLLTQSLLTYQNSSSANVRVDTGQTGPAVEEFHYYYDQWPIGLAVSKQGRVFVCYTRGTYVGHIPCIAIVQSAKTNQSYTLGEVSNITAEVPFPDLATNSPPGGLSTTLNGIGFGSSSNSTFISVQALFVTPDDTLWVLDTGRPSINESKLLTMPYAQPGGPKLVAMNLSNNSISRTYTFPPSVHYPDSYSRSTAIPCEPFTLCA